MKGRRVIETEAWTDSGQQVNAAGGPDEDEGPRTNALLTSESGNM
jgi:hypothetical protein